MEQKKSNYGNLAIFIVITASVIALGMYYLQKPPSVMPVTQKTLSEYYSSRNQFVDNSMKQNPEGLGFKEIARVTVACPKNLDKPCATDRLILAMDELHSGDQDFYLAQEGTAGYSYYGPFTDNLKHIIDESNTIAPL